MRIKRSKEEWAALVNEQRKGSKSIAGFCKEKGIHPNLFYRKIKKANNPATFVKLPVVPLEHRSIAIRAGNVTIIVPRPFSNEELIQVLECVGKVIDA